YVDAARGAGGGTRDRYSAGACRGSTDGRGAPGAPDAPGAARAIRAASDSFELDAGDAVRAVDGHALTHRREGDHPRARRALPGVRRGAAARTSDHILSALRAESDDDELPGMRRRARGGLEILSRLRTAGRSLSRSKARPALAGEPC